MSPRINRRALLRGIGTALSLPLLESMAATKPPCRMAFLYVPNGIMMDQWIPDHKPGVTALPAELPAVTRELAAHRDDLLFVGGLTQNGGRALGDGPGDHGRAGASYLTCVHPKQTNGRDLHAGISVDQIAADRLRGKTRLASLELGCEEGVQGGSCDNGYSCAYSNSISWRTPSSPNPAEIRPRAVFERLFGAAPEPGEDPVRRARYERSVLDVVTAEASSLSAKLGGADRRKLDEYLYSIRDVEKRIQAVEKQPVARPGIAAPDASIPAELGEHAHLMIDLLALAFQTDSTRVATLLLALESRA